MSGPHSDHVELSSFPDEPSSSQEVLINSPSSNEPSALEPDRYLDARQSVRSRPHDNSIRHPSSLPQYTRLLDSQEDNRPVSPSTATWTTDRPLPEGDSSTWTDDTHATPISKKHSRMSLLKTAPMGYLRSFYGKELPKAICSNNRLSAICHFALFHLPPIAVTLSLLSLYIKEFYWPSLRPTINELNALLFAAKAHESLILVSLTDILLHRICYGLIVQGNGIPLGFISSAFHLGDPLRYITSWEFWSSSMRKHFSNAVTSVIIFIATLICISASPLSAIAMIPVQVWQPLDFPSDEFGAPSDFVRARTTYVPRPIYRTYLDSRDVPSRQRPELKCSDIGKAHCQKPNITNMLPNLGALMTGGKYEFTEAVYSMYGSVRFDRPTSIRYSPETFTYLFCPMTFAADVFKSESGWFGVAQYEDIGSSLVNATLGSIGTSRRTKLKMPLVGADCERGYFNEKNMTVEFFEGDHWLLELGREPDSIASWTEFINSLTGPLDHKQGNFKLGNFPGRPDSTILFASIDNESHRKPDDISFNMCTVEASWVEANTWVDMVNPARVQASLTEKPRFDDGNTGLDDLDIGYVKIQMHGDWLYGIGQLNRTSRSAYHAMASFCAGNNQDGASFPIEGCLEIALGAHVADALASGPELKIYDPDDFSISAPTENDTLVNLEAQVLAYGYLFSNSRAIPYAFGVLLSHALIALVHMVVVLASPRPWHGSCWGSFGQMLILALRSRAPRELDKVGGGVESAQTWTRTATVRAVGEEGRVEILLDEEGGAGGLEDSALYAERVQAKEKYN